VIKPRLTGSLITFAAAFIVTNRLDMALSIAAIECVAKLGLALSKG